MSKENKTILIKRFKSFAWRAGMLAAVGVLTFLGDNIDLFDLGVMEVIVAGIISLALSEVTKWLNT